MTANNNSNTEQKSIYGKNNYKNKKKRAEKKSRELMKINILQKVRKSTKL